jgi:hypothetical protein
MDRLKTALQLTTHDLARSMATFTLVSLKLHVARIQPPSVLPWHLPATHCSACGQDGVQSHHADIVLCTRPEAMGTVAGSYFTHIIIRRKFTVGHTDKPVVTLCSRHTVGGYDIQFDAIVYQSEVEWISPERLYGAQKKSQR